MLSCECFSRGSSKIFAVFSYYPGTKEPHTSLKRQRAVTTVLEAVRTVAPWKVDVVVVGYEKYQGFLGVNLAVYLALMGWSTYLRNKTKDVAVAAWRLGFGHNVPKAHGRGLLSRLVQAPWFQLRGEIRTTGHVQFPLGDGAEFEAAEDGELFLYVNDVPGFYDNNHGSATVTISRPPRCPN